MLAILAWTAPAYAQDVSGVVVDPQDRRVAGASVTLTCGEFLRRTTTDREGRFTLLQEGSPQPCTLRVAVPGFLAAVVPIAPADGCSHAVRLAIEPVAETVEVRPAAAPAAVGNSLTGDQARAISDDPNDVLRFAKARAGPAAGHAVYVDGLPARQLPPVSRIAGLTVNGDPYSAEYSDPGLQRIDITTSAPTRAWRVDLGGSPQTIDGANPLGEHSGSTSLRAGVAGPSPWAGGAFSLLASVDALDNQRAIVAVVPGATAGARRIVPSTTDRRTATFQISQSLAPSSVLRVEGTRIVRTTANAGVGGEVLPEAGHAAEGTATELRVTVGRQSRTLSWRNQFLADWATDRTRAASTEAGIQVPGAFTRGGATLTSATTDRTWAFAKSVVESRAGRLPWRAGIVVERARQRNREAPNEVGSIQISPPAAGQGEAPVGTLFRVARPTVQQVALLGAATFADVTPLQGSRGRVVAGARVDWQSGDRVRVSPRLSGTAQAAGWSLSGGVGWFTQSWRPEIFQGTRAAEGEAPLRMMTRGVSVASVPESAVAGEPIVMDVAPGLTRARYLMTGQAAERPVGRLTFGVEHVWWRGRHLLGAERLRDQAGTAWTDWLESNRRIDSHEVRVRIGIGDAKRSASATYAWMRSVDDTDGAWSFPARQGDLAGERARSARMAAHNLDIVGSALLPLGVRLTAVASLRGPAPYDIVSGLDAEANGLFTDRGGLPRNSGRLPGTRSVALYVSRRFNVASLLGPAANVPIDVGAQFENVLGTTVWTTLGNVTGSPLFGHGEGAMPGRSIRVWFALAR